MASDSSIKAFNAYVGSAVNYYKTKKGWTNHQLAIGDWSSDVCSSDLSISNSS